MNTEETPSSLNPLPEFGPPQTTASSMSGMYSLVLVASVFIPLYPFLFLWRGSIYLGHDAAKVIRGMSFVILPIPMVALAGLTCQYVYYRFWKKAVPSVLPSRLRLSSMVLALWVSALTWQAHKDIVFERNLEAQIQPWGESLLAKPPSTVLKRGSRTIGQGLIPAFLGPCEGVSATQEIPVPPWFAGERCVVVFYGGSMVGSHGYVVGRKKLDLPTNDKLHKIKDGVYIFP